MTFWDAIFVAVFAALLPFMSYRHFRNLVRTGTDAATFQRKPYYYNTIIVQWIFLAAFMLLWGAQDRDWSALGVRFELTPGFWIAAVIAAGVLGYFVMKIHKGRSGGESETPALGAAELLVPRTRRELHLFYGVSFTAGIVEEFLYRGYMIWLLQLIVPIWPAAAISAVVFGLAHMYQGWSQLPGLLLAGAVMATVFVLSGSLWLPILLHIFGDMLQGRMMLEAYSRQSEHHNNPVAAA